MTLNKAELENVSDEFNPFLLDNTEPGFESADADMHMALVAGKWDEMVAAQKRHIEVGARDTVSREEVIKIWKKVWGERDEVKDNMKKFLEGGDLGDILLNETSNQDIMDKFFTGNFPKSQEDMKNYGFGPHSRFKPSWGSNNLTISKKGNGWVLINYSILIVYKASDGKVYFNTNKYSVTTSKLQNQMRFAASQAGVELIDVDEAGLRAAMDRD